MTPVDEQFMRLALKEARKGLGRTSPNPCVGAVVVRGDRVIGKGYHRRAGTPHAEINALNDARESVQGATIYVTLEPCSHTGRTPPCCEALVAAGIGRVVIGMQDPNPMVDGKGVAYLKSHGLEVASGILEDDCRRLNNWFVKYIRTGLPWVVMKAGVSLDGRLTYQSAKQGWMTGEKSRRAVHRLRNHVDGILIGRGTAVVDNPSLTCRLPGTATRDPVRIIVDSKLRIPLSSRVLHLRSQASTWICCSYGCDPEKKARLEALGAVIIEVREDPAGLDLSHLLQILGSRGICSLLVEGGARVHGSFLGRELYDEVFLFTAPLFAGDGGEPLLRHFTVGSRDSAPRLDGVSYRRLGEDIMISGIIRYR